MIRVRAGTWAVTAAALLASTGGWAQDAEEEALGEIVVTGTRVAGRVATETLSPVDLVSGDELFEQASFDLTDSLARISPSVNTQRFPIADGTAFIRPVSLRNLSPDHTLVLVNGTRRHKSALVNLQLAPLGTVNQGSQGVDWSAFPSLAIERVEVLRDGASAQYGSDAIAGVVNVIMKENREGMAFSTQYGEYSESDGERLSVSGNIGLPLGAEGYASLTGEYSTSEITSRGVARADALAVAAACNCPVPQQGLGQRWGDPDVEALKFMINAGIPFGEDMELYGTANYMDNSTVSGFFYRVPVLPNAADQQQVPARTTLQIDGNADGLPDNATPAQVAAITSVGEDPADYLTASTTSPTGWVLRNPIHTNFPGGYNPDFGADLMDMGVILGLRGDLTANLSWDVTGRYEENEVEYTLENSINPSLGRLSPTSFTPGTLKQEESGLNLDFVQTFERSPLNLAFGAELRNETYVIEAGDPASIQPGPTAAIFGVGSDGFQGFPTESAGEFKSDSYAGYVDLETDIGDRFTAGVALRYEDYDEFGDTFDWKVSGRVKLSDAFAIRATANTGFRAPTPGQVNTLNVTTTANAAGLLIPNGTYPVDHPIAVTLGAIPLVPEESASYTAGVVFTPANNWSITLDYYNIEIEDRLAVLNNAIGAAEVALLTAAGIPNAGLLLGSNANFFVNGFDSDVTGVDLALTTNFDVGAGNLIVDLRHNWNEMEVSNVATDTINADRVYDLENQVPEQASVLTFDYSSGGLFSGLLRLNYYGDYSTTAGLFGPGDGSVIYDYDAEVLVDLELRATFESFTFTLGAENVLDTQPGDEQDPVASSFGVRYSLVSPFGFNGAFYYARLNASF
jgi:iron complex outermembrane receptor protein